MPYAAGVYTVPPGTEATTLTAIDSSDYNAFVDDIEAAQNAIRPIVAGGTGASSASAAMVSLLPTPFKVTRYTSSGTHTYATTARWRRVRLVGGGGGGGGADCNDVTFVCCGGSGGAGGFVEDFRAVPAATAAVVVGSLGAASNTSGGDGGTGGDSTYTETGVLLTGSGGVGGAGGAGGLLAGYAREGGLGGVASGGNIVNVAGQPGGASVLILNATDGRTYGATGAGGSNNLGSGANCQAIGTTSTRDLNGYAPPAGNFGAGGGGAIQSKINSTGATGAAGRAGVVIVEEYY